MDGIWPSAGGGSAPVDSQRRAPNLEHFFGLVAGETVVLEIKAKWNSGHVQARNLSVWRRGRLGRWRKWSWLLLVLGEG